MQMRDREMKRLLSLMSQLTFNQRMKLRDELFRQSAAAEVTQVIESQGNGLSQCPHCRSERVVRNGQADGLQRYKCRGCGKTFNALSGTPMARLRHKGKWLAQSQVLSEGLSVHAAAKRLQVAPSTAFRWRHRFLAQAQAIKARVLMGIAEADETFVLRSNKGQHNISRQARRRGSKSSTRGTSDDHVPVLVVRDRSGACTDFMLGRSDKVQLTAALAPVLAPDVVLCTDGSSAMAAAAHQIGVEHHALNMTSGTRTRGPWHIQNVNAYHGRLKAWMQRFRGVATKYLASYLGWFRALDRFGPATPQPAEWLALALSPAPRP
jgi:transposase-like protein